MKIAANSGSCNSKALITLFVLQIKIPASTNPNNQYTRQELFNIIKARYDNQVSPYYAAARLWTDAIIDPLETRTWISMGIEAANHSPIEKKFNLGVIQV